MRKGTVQSTSGLQCGSSVKGTFDWLLIGSPTYVQASRNQLAHQIREPIPCCAYSCINLFCGLSNADPSSVDGAWCRCGPRHSSSVLSHCAMYRLLVWVLNGLSVSPCAVHRCVDCLGSILEPLDVRKELQTQQVSHWWRVETQRGS